MTTYQLSKTNVIEADRHSKNGSQFAEWVKTNFPGKYLVSVNPVDSEGVFSFQPLKNRGYQFSGAGSDHIERGLLVGKKMWFKSFDSEDIANAEVDILTETGI